MKARQTSFLLYNVQILSSIKSKSYLRHYRPTDSAFPHLQSKSCKGKPCYLTISEAFEQFIIMSDPYRSNYYGSTYAPQDQYGGAPYPGSGYSQVRPPSFPIILHTPLITNILTLLSHSHHTSINSNCLSPDTRPDPSPRMPWLHLSPPSPTLATTAAPAHDPLIPTGTIIATARARDPVMQAVLAPPVVIETRAAQKGLEPL